MTDHLNNPHLDAILRAPDSDETRLAWAHEVGAERGEFVRVQCALARTDLARTERHRLAARERELLLTSARLWSGLDDIATPHFRRGFVEEIDITLANLATYANELVSRAPLLRALHVRDMPGRISGLASWPPNYLWPQIEDQLNKAFESFTPGQISALAVEPAAEWYDSDGGNLHAMGDECVAWIAQAQGLRLLTSLTSLTVRNGYVTRTIKTHLCGMTSLDELALHNHGLQATDVLDILRNVPQLTRLALSYGEEPFEPQALRALLTAPESSRLRALDLRGHELSSNEIAMAASLPLERLAFYASRISPHAFDALMANTKLRELTLSGTLDDRQLQKLPQARFAGNLRRLELSGNAPSASQLGALLAFPALEYLCISQQRGTRATAALEALIPEVVVRWTWR